MFDLNIIMFFSVIRHFSSLFIMFKFSFFIDSEVLVVLVSNFYGLYLMYLMYVFVCLCICYQFMQLY